MKNPIKLYKICYTYVSMDTFLNLYSFAKMPSYLPKAPSGSEFVI